MLDEFRECVQLLYGRSLPLRLQGAVYKSCVMPAIVCGSEAWCLKANDIGILGRTERVIVGAMCGVQLNDRKNMSNGLDADVGYE